MAEPCGMIANAHVAEKEKRGKEMKLLLSLLTALSLTVSQPCLASVKFVSLCEVALMKKALYGKSLYTVGTFASIPRHYYYLYDEKCPAYKFLIQISVTTNSELAKEFNTSINANRGSSTKHILEFKGTLEHTRSEHNLYGHYEGVFVVDEMLRAEQIQ